MSIRASKISSLQSLYRQLGHETDFRDRHGDLYYSTRRWSENYVDHDGTTGQSMIQRTTAKGISDLEKVSQKFLDEGHGVRLWPQTSGGGLEYPRDQKRLVDLLAQIFWNQNTNIDKADRKRTKQQKQHDLKDEGAPFTHASPHTTGSSMAHGQSCYEGFLVSGNITNDYSSSPADLTRQDMYARARLNAGNDHVHATQLYANGRGIHVLDAQKPVTLDDQQESPLNVQNDTAPSALPPTPSHQVRTGADVFDFVGSDDERQVHGHRKGLVLTFRFTLNIRQYQNCMATYAGRPAPTANMISLPRPPVVALNEIPKRHAISPDQCWATNGLSEILEGQVNDNPGAITPRRAIKGAFNVSGLSRAHSGTTEVEDTKQRPLDITEASITPSKENDIEVHASQRTPSEQNTGSETPSEMSVDNDDKDDKTYTPGKASEAKRSVSKRPKMFIDRSKATKKRRLGVKRQDDKRPSLHLKDLINSELHLDSETSSIVKQRQLGLDSFDTSLARASGERGDLEHSLASSTYTHLKASECHLGTTPSTQTREGEGNGGDDRVHMESTSDAEKINNCYEDGSHGNPILIQEESPPPIEDRPIYSRPTLWQSDLAAATKAIGEMVSVEKSLAPLNQGDTAEIKDEQYGLPCYSTKDIMRRERDLVARIIALPRATPETGRVLPSPPLPYHHARGQSGREGYTPYNSSRRVVSTGRPQDLDWKRDAAAWSLPPAMTPQDIERASNISLISCSKPTADGLASSDQDGLTQNREERARSPDTSIQKGHERDEKVSRNLTEQSILPLPNTTYSMISSPSRLPPQARPKIEEAWFIRVNKQSGGPYAYRLSEFHLDDMTLASTFDLATTKVPIGTEIRNISLSIRSYQYDKDFPQLTEMVEKDDKDGFERVKLEFMDLIREYVHEGVTRYKFLLEVNPKEKRGRHLVSGAGDGMLG